MNQFSKKHLYPQELKHSRKCLVENFSLTPGFSRVRKVREERKPFKRFSLAHSWFTALKRGVNEMISKEHPE
jgi:hypothetical protein